jgi:hypothetical protein
MNFFDQENVEKAKMIFFPAKQTLLKKLLKLNFFVLSQTIFGCSQKEHKNGFILIESKSNTTNQESYSPQKC